jgi:hypothetical protein
LIPFNLIGELERKIGHANFNSIDCRRKLWLVVMKEKLTRERKKRGEEVVFLQRENRSVRMKGKVDLGLLKYLVRQDYHFAPT